MEMPGEFQESIHGRRRVLAQLGLTAVGSLCAPSWLAGLGTGPHARSTPHPHLFWRKDIQGNLRTIGAVKQAIQHPGLSRQIWKRIEAECLAEFGADPLTCRSSIPDRPEGMAAQNNPDYTICHAVGQRILRHSMALHLTENGDHKRIAMEQLEALFDPRVWPDWIDQAHLRFDLPADLRTGMLSQDVGIAYDWLYPFLNDAERAFIIAGLDRRGIQPYLQSIEMDPWWAHDLNNWYTVIIGGLGIAGMALGTDHPEAGRLVQLSVPKMERYLSIYGKDGSFNESVAYSGATRIPVEYFNAYYYHRGGEENPLLRQPFPQTAEWTIYATLPPGRWACFGDGRAEDPVYVSFMTALAAATRNPIIQDYAVRHLRASAKPFELLWLDDTLEGSSPQGKLPLGKAFHENSALIFSRSTWDPDDPGMIVYGKAKRAGNHGHNDLGQLCIDVDGSRMITDLGSPSGYPADFFDDVRYRYYNASIFGHNIPMFGGREQRHPSEDRGEKGELDLSSTNGSILDAHFDEEKGGYWQLDLTPAYSGVQQVRRTVIHLFPGLVAVLDEAELLNPEAISMRWHTIHPAEPDARGNFRVIRDRACLDCRIESLSAKPKSIKLEQHAYEFPYDRDRTGQPLEQRHEPFVELLLKDSACRILSLFALSGPDSSVSWKRKGNTWSWNSVDAAAEVLCTEKILSVRDIESGNAFEVTL